MICDVTRDKDANFNELKSLFRVIAAQSTSQKLFLVPIVAGTVIGAIREAVAATGHDSVSIPLRLLKPEYAMEVIMEALRKHREKHKNTLIPYFVDESEELQQLVVESSGHCRILEYILIYLQHKQKNWEDNLGYWQLVKDELYTKLFNKYNLRDKPIAGAIAYSLLSLEANEQSVVPEDRGYTFLDLMEKGCIKIENGKVKCPILFIKSYLRIVDTSRIYFGRFWRELVKSDDTYLPGWEKFCNLYLAFRLAMFSFLKRHNNNYDSVKFEVFFNGFMISDDLKGKILMIPDEAQIISSTAVGHQFPNDFPPIGHCVINAGSGKFGAYVFLSTSVRKTPLLS
jgi:hypothetical protein